MEKPLLRPLNSAPITVTAPEGNEDEVLFKSTPHLLIDSCSDSEGYGQDCENDDTQIFFSNENVRNTNKLNTVNISHNRSQSVRSYRRGELLSPAVERPRMASVPYLLPDEELYRLREFNTSGKRLICRGDSFKRRLNRSANSLYSSRNSIA